MMKRIAVLAIVAVSLPLTAPAQGLSWQPDLTVQQTYVQHRTSSVDPTGANADERTVPPGATLTVLDTNGPGTISHIWFTMNDREAYSLKRVVLRVYWDGETSPSVEAPIGDFFGQGLGYYYNWHSEMLSVGSSKALNSFFPMPFQHHARITVTNQGNDPIQSLYYNIDYRTYSHPLSADTLYFHAEYHQEQPNRGWTNKWTSNGDPTVNDKANLSGKDNYVWLDA
ncbi:MAG: DUF2961 domain-containing protein, partial [Acidobacteriaceae bacterium]